MGVEKLEKEIAELSEKMSAATDKAEADKEYASSLAKIIDEHCKSLVAQLPVEAIVAFGFTAGGYPLVPANIVAQELTITDKLVP